MKKFCFILLLFVVPLLRSQAADIELPEMGDSAGALISPEQEYQIGQSFFWRLQQSVQLISDAEINHYIRSLGNRLVMYSDAAALPFTFFMVDDTTINAFAVPGGFIGVHSGLVLASESEAELASVLAHEIVHISQRHLLRGFEQAKQVNLVTAVGLIAGLILSVSDPHAGSAALLAAGAGGVQARLNFSRAHEAEADNLGMLLLVRAGFDPQAMPTFFQRLQHASRFYPGDSVPEFLRTHPVTTNRIAEARGRAASYQVQPQLTDKLQFYLMREKLRVLGTQDVTELLRYYQEILTNSTSLKQTATRYGYSLALAKQGNYSGARAQLQRLIAADRERLAYQLALADLDIAAGKLAAAITIYQQQQRLYPNHYALTISHAIALLLANLPEQASALLLTQAESGAVTIQLYKLLAQAQGDAGDNSQAHSWLAEYYYHAGQLAQAVDQLRLAADFANGDEYQLAKIAARLTKVEAALALQEKW